MVQFSLSRSDVSTSWQYGLWSFPAGGTKLEATYLKEIIENWENGEVSKIGHHF